jgi:hypothetical protein
MKTRAIGAMILVLVSAAAPALAADGSVELFNVTINSNGSAGAVDFNACQAPVTVLFNGLLGRVSIAVYARLSGATLAGMSGIEMYLDGLEVGTDLPAGWSVVPTFAANLLIVGELAAPHTQGGEIRRRVNATWTVDLGPNDPNCQKDPLVFIARVDLSSPIGSPSLPNDLVVTAGAGDPPNNPNFNCPVLFLCDNPIFTPNCATGSRFVINPVNESCMNAIEERSWGAVKALFR